MARKNIICQIALLTPKRVTEMDNPTKHTTRTGFLPCRSAIRPQKTMGNIWTMENIDSWSFKQTIKGGGGMIDSYDQPSIKPNILLINVHTFHHCWCKWK